MSHPVIMKTCECGKTWDTHGLYSTCPYCAKGVNASRDATPQETLGYNDMLARWKAEAIANVEKETSR